MNRFPTLIKGELVRLKKYNLFAASIFVSLMWVGVLHFVNMEDVTKIIPQLVFIDVTTMAVLLVGVTFIYEREESTIRSILVTPISKCEYILSKTLANIIPSILSLTIMFVYAKIFKIVDINYFLILLGVILVAFFHSLLGFILTFYSKDFTDLVMTIMKIFLIFILPVILDEFNVITNKVFKGLVYIIPTKSTLMILMGTTGAVKSFEIIISVLYMFLGSGILYYLVWKNFKKYALRESGE